ncbi:hypothetical protein [Hymenobacter metallilatus]|uniref:hypothetical protein n=1 Tax=Hymenobacter metallilatus TaxID=2493666 RepID=UPI00163A57F4|nr:hypothetical protein [Hymenobacter metallilatus]
METTVTTGGSQVYDPAFWANLHALRQNLIASANSRYFTQEEKSTVRFNAESCTNQSQLRKWIDQLETMESQRRKIFVPMWFEDNSTVFLLKKVSSAD